MKQEIAVDRDFIACKARRIGSYLRRNRSGDYCETLDQSLPHASNITTQFCFENGYGQRAWLTTSKLMTLGSHTSLRRTRLHCTGSALADKKICAEHYLEQTGPALLAINRYKALRTFFNNFLYRRARCDHRSLTPFGSGFLPQLCNRKHLGR